MAAARQAPFDEATLAFLDDLAANNNRDWFNDNKARYEEHVLDAALRFIQSMQEPLARIAPHFTAIPQRVGGSLMRVYRDTRFAKNKSPYKTNIGIQFRHELGKDIHAPGYYLHISPGECFVGVGLWHPDADALFKIREAIVQKPEAWTAARDDAAFCKHYELVGDALANAPRGFAKDHPQAEDLKRKDFIALANLSEATVASSKLRPLVVERYRQAAPLMLFLCQALELRF
jgi:uncharacterized protein (TIGR02453 family)